MGSCWPWHGYSAKLSGFSLSLLCRRGLLASVLVFDVLRRRGGTIILDSVSVCQTRRKEGKAGPNTSSLFCREKETLRRHLDRMYISLATALSWPFHAGTGKLGTKLVVPRKMEALQGKGKQKLEVGFVANGVSQLRLLQGKKTEYCFGRGTIES